MGLSPEEMAKRVAEVEKRQKFDQETENVRYEKIRAEVERAEQAIEDYGKQHRSTAGLLKLMREKILEDLEKQRVKNLKDIESAAAQFKVVETGLAHLAKQLDEVRKTAAGPADIKVVLEKVQAIDQRVKALEGKIA
ncbi:hypothetical protein [Limnoglobus roseus]|uniref:Chromosome partition protein Smc n=1 Tax=Limnoglobus roseus TaxID=2598579 RepID=A0A5C1AGZ8_9BACT|nr:hypothetical protein [Limnoglobus roseus]QEL17523.1 hypothetical protein PX52LOC_04513 [Limnoglobus roseus]